MKYALMAAVALALTATASVAQVPATPAPEAVPGVPTSSSPACAVARQDMQSPCSINATSPECLTAKKAFVSCMAGFDAANGKGPCAQQNTLMLRFCTADTSSQQCRNARVGYNSCIENPPGYPAAAP